jgi:DNA-binding CsgD family transcriptional regulator
VLLLREAEAIGEERGWPRLVAASLAESIRLFVADGKIEEAEACRGRLAEVAATSTIAANAQHLSRQLAIADAYLSLAKGPSAGTAATLRAWVSASMLRRERYLAVELTLLLACVLHSLGELDEASIELTRAIELGAASGLYRTFLDGGERIRRLLACMYDRRAAEGGILAELRPYVRTLLIGFSGRVETTEGARSRYRPGESLSPRERHIVSLMSHGLSNKRIAKQLGIAPETVKSHAKHILQKLAAQTRVEAVSRSLSLGII